jgi:hypothetical protein
MVPAQKKPVSPWSNIALLPNDTLFDRMCELQQHPPTCVKPSTFKSYVTRLRRVRKQHHGLPLINIICKAQEAISLLEQNAAVHLAANTLTDDLGAVLATAKHAMSERQRTHTTHYMTVWQAAHKRVQDQAKAAFNSNKAISDKQRNGFVPYRELCAVRDSLPYGNQLRLWLAMSTMIPCARAGDYANCRLYFHAPTQQELTAHADNYLVLTTEAQYVHLRVFKTARCYPNGIKIAIPRCLSVEIAQSLQLNRRHHLFVQEKDATKPYEIHKSFAGYLEKHLKHALRNADATPQLVRRAWVTEAHAHLRPALESGDPGRVALAKAKMTLIAHCCAHEVSTHEKYIYDLDDGGKPELMEVTAIAPLPPAVSVAPVSIEFEDL